MVGRMCRLTEQIPKRGLIPGHGEWRRQRQACSVGHRTWTLNIYVQRAALLPTWKERVRQCPKCMQQLSSLGGPRDNIIFNVCANARRNYKVILVSTSIETGSSSCWGGSEGARFSGARLPGLASCGRSGNLKRAGDFRSRGAGLR
jgi:hypothetical protein